MANVEPDDSNRQWAVWGSHLLIGDVLHDEGNLAGALSHHRAALAIAQRIAKPAPDSAESQWRLSWSRSYVAGVLYTKGDRAGALAVWRKELATLEASASAVEQEEIKSAGKPGAATAGALRWVGSQALLARDFAKLQAAAERASTLAPNLVWPDALRAHGLLFRNRTRQASALYLAQKGKGRLIDGRPWERAIAEDFRVLHRAGLTHPAMPRIEAALGIASGKQPTITRRARK